MDAKHVQLIGSGRDPRYFQCLCGIHVHRGAFIIAFIGLIFSLFSIGSTALLTPISLPMPIISFILYLFVLVANKYEKPALYLPFIILNSIGVLALFCISIIFILSGTVFAGAGLAFSDKPESRQGFGFVGAATVVTGVILLLWTFLSGYFIHVVYRAYRYLKEVVLNPNVMLAQAGGPGEP